MSLRGHSSVPALGLLVLLLAGTAAPLLGQQGRCPGEPFTFTHAQLAKAVRSGPQDWLFVLYGTGSRTLGTIKPGEYQVIDNRQQMELRFPLPDLRAGRYWVEIIRATNAAAAERTAAAQRLASGDFRREIRAEDGIRIIERCAAATGADGGGEPEIDWSDAKITLRLHDITADEPGGTLENPGDELALRLLRFGVRLGEFAIINTYSGSPSIETAPTGTSSGSVRLGENWFKEGETHRITGATISETAHPYEAVGVIPVLFEMNSSSRKDRDDVMQCLQSRLASRFGSGTRPDYSNRTRTNLEFIASSTVAHIRLLMNDFGGVANICDDRLGHTLTGRRDVLLTLTAAVWIHAPGLAEADVRDLIDDLDFLEFPRAGEFHVIPNHAVDPHYWYSVRGTVEVN